MKEDRRETLALSGLAPPARLELTTLRLGGVRSIQESYRGINGVILSYKARDVKKDPNEKIF